MANNNQDIQELLNRISNAVYGIEVRDAIHDSIEQCYEDVSAAKTLSETATASATSAASSASSAATAATTAKTNADTAAAAANTAASAANTAATRAGTAADRVDTALASANQAILDCNTATNNANIARTNATNAASSATSAATAATASKTTADAAATAANTAASTATAAATRAGTAADRVDSALTSVNQAVLDCNTAAGNANTATANATNAASAASAAATAASTAKTNADTAAAAANTAASAATTAKNEADASASNARSAASAASLAANDANAVIADAQTAISECGSAAYTANLAATSATRSSTRANEISESLEGLTVTSENVGPDGLAEAILGEISGHKNIHFKLKQGASGAPYIIKGNAYSSLAALESAITSPAIGDQYNVGTAPPYNVYRWTGTTWEDQGAIGISITDITVAEINAIYNGETVPGTAGKYLNVTGLTHLITNKILTALSGKVDTVAGKGLSTNDFTNAYVSTINDLGDQVTVLASSKVDKVSGKGLSSNDFTNSYKSQVSDNTTARHTHSNKSVLDGITSTDVSNWNSKPKFDDIYPVGAFWWSTAVGSPAAQGLSAGTWEQIKDTFLLAAGDTYTAGATGGERTHTLTITEMPHHRHLTMAYGAAGTTAGYRISNPNTGVTNEVNSYPTMYEGGGGSHNNMPPYLTAYCWHRIA